MKRKKRILDGEKTAKLQTLMFLYGKTLRLASELADLRVCMELLAERMESVKDGMESVKDGMESVKDGMESVKNGMESVKDGMESRPKEEGEDTA